MFKQSNFYQSLVKYCYMILVIPYDLGQNVHLYELDFNGCFEWNLSHSCGTQKCMVCSFNL